MDPTGPVASRFPLIARPRPVCSPLAVRVGEISDLAHSAAQTTDSTAASAVFNRAALIASDCGLPDLAREWCRRHAQIYLTSDPLNARLARLAIEPLVNLARLHIRDGNGGTAFEILDALHTAVRTRTETLIDTIPFPATTLTQTSEDHHELLLWLWAIHLSESTRALTSAGRWQEAHQHLLRHNGIGRRMLDGRQVAAITHHTTGNTDEALALLDDTTPGEPWEAAITACLKALCDRSADHLATMLTSYRQLVPTPGLMTFHTRLGLTVIDAIGDSATHPVTRKVSDELIRTITASRDGYSARDLLGHHGCTDALTTKQRRELVAIVDTCALGHRDSSADLITSLTDVVVANETVLARAIDARSKSALLTRSRRRPLPESPLCPVMTHPAARKPDPHQPG